MNSACYSRRPMQDAVARVLSVTEHPLPYYSVRFLLPAEFAHSEPGQFVMVQVGDRLEPYLRRPFSVHDLRSTEEGCEVELLGRSSAVAPGSWRRLDLATRCGCWALSGVASSSKVGAGSR